MVSATSTWLVSVSFVASLIGSLSGRADDVDLSFETVVKQFDGGPEKAGETVIRTEEEWSKFIETCSSESLRKELREQTIDFDKATIVAVAVGANSSILGHEDYEKQAGVQRVRTKDGATVVSYTNV